MVDKIDTNIQDTNYVYKSTIMLLNIQKQTTGCKPL